jgi:hypothetical protein
VDDETESSGVVGKEVRADDAALGEGGGAVNLMKGILPPRAVITYRIINWNSGKYSMHAKRR